MDPQYRWDSVWGRELYDVGKDFFETKNVVNVDEYADIVKEMSEKLRSQMMWHE